jgi:hypothetical protein
MSEKIFSFIAGFKQLDKRCTLYGVEIISYQRVFLVVIFGVFALVAAIMNYLESPSVSYTDYLLFITPVLIFIVAGMLYREETG